MKTCIAFIVLIASVLATGCGRNASAAAPAPGGGVSVERGEHLVAIMGCHDCHTPLTMGPNGPEPDLSRGLSGHPEEIGPLTPASLDGPWIAAASPTNTAHSGPWGISYTANLTPDVNTGLGIWTEEMFLTAIRTGRHMGRSRPINPPMPWPAYRNATDDELKSVFAYLRSLKPIVNHVPDYQPPPGNPVS